jgi:hypothetical protein
MCPTFAISCSGQPFYRREFLRGPPLTQSICNKITSAATAGAAATLPGAQLCLWRGSSTGLGGFYLCMRGGIDTFQATCRTFMGLYSALGSRGSVL